MVRSFSLISVCFRIVNSTDVIRFVYRYYTTRRKDLGVATLFLDQSSVVLHLTGLNFSIPLLTFVPLCGVTAWLASGVLSLSAMASEWFHKHDDPDADGWHW